MTLSPVGDKSNDAATCWWENQWRCHLLVGKSNDAATCWWEIQWRFHLLVGKSNDADDAMLPLPIFHLNSHTTWYSCWTFVTQALRCVRTKVFLVTSLLCTHTHIHTHTHTHVSTRVVSNPSFINRVGLNHIPKYSVYTVYLAGKSPNIRSKTVYIYGSGQPYSLMSARHVWRENMRCSVFPLCKCLYMANWFSYTTVCTVFSFTGETWMHMLACSWLIDVAASLLFERCMCHASACICWHIALWHPLKCANVMYKHMRARLFACDIQVLVPSGILLCGIHLNAPI